MTSQLNVDTIVDKAGSGGTNVKIGNTSTYVSDGGGATQNTVQGIAKTWLVHNSASLQNSLNVSSVTDNSQGNQTISFSNSMANTNYVIAGLLGNNNNSASNTINLTRPYQWNTSSYKSVTLYNSGVGAVTDYDHTDNMVVGDLA